MLRLATIFCALATIAGCAEYQERQRQAEIANQPAPPPDHDAQCRSYGAVHGTPAYTQCRMQLQQQDEARRQAVVGVLLGNMRSAPPIAIAPIPTPSAPPPNRTINCTSTGYGGTVNTNCY